MTALFLGVILGSIGIHGERNSTKRWVCLFVNVASWMFLFAGIGIVVSNLYCFLKLKWHIEKHTQNDKPCTDKEKGKESPYSFLGRPGKTGKNTKGSDVSLDDWAPFWDVDDEKKITINPRVEKKSDGGLPGRWKEKEDENGYVKRIYSGVLKEDIMSGSSWHVPAFMLAVGLSLLGLATFLLAAS